MDVRYNEFFKFFEKKEYFHCHEILEEIWIDETDYITRDHPAVALLLFSVGLFHWKRGNFRGAAITFTDSLERTLKVEGELKELGIDCEQLKIRIKMALDLVDNNKTYRELKIPFIYNKK